MLPSGNRNYFVFIFLTNNGGRRACERIFRCRCICMKTDNDFINQASYFIISQALTEKREVNFEKYVRVVDPRNLKDFLGSIVQNFCIKDGRIESIRFKNWVEHRFLYKNGDD